MLQAPNAIPFRFAAVQAMVWLAMGSACGKGDTVGGEAYFARDIALVAAADATAVPVGDATPAPMDTAGPPEDIQSDVARDVFFEPPPDVQTTSNFGRDTDELAGDSGDVGGGGPTEAACNFDQDCQACAFPTAPKSVDDCYCVLCPTNILAIATCDANAAAWESVCDSGAWPERNACPTPRCIGAPAGACADGRCQAACDLARCPELACPPEEQVRTVESCCPRCTGVSSCRNGRDCEHCYYPRPVAGPDDCYCPTCETTVSSSAQCDANRASWETHCQPWPLPGPPCGDVICLVDTTPLICDIGGECALDPNRCRFNRECTTCQFAAVPNSPGDCTCPECPVATSQSHCDAILDATADLCVNFDYASCPNTNCLTPSRICDPSSNRCSFNGLFER